jgi:hypothetical protein
LLNNREIAVLFWLAVVVVVAVSRRDLRPSLVAVIRAALARRIVTWFVAMAAYVAGLVYLGYRLDLWSPSLLKDTIIWFIGPAVVLFFNMTKAGEGGFFRRAAVATVEVTAVVAFALNVFVLDLGWELVLQPVVAILVMLSAYSATDEQYAPAKKLADGLLVLIGLVVLAVTATKALHHWRDVDLGGLSLDFVLPIWLTLGLLPFIFALGLVSAYELLFLRIGFAAPSDHVPLSVRLGLIAGLGLRIRQVRAFTHPWYRRAAAAKSWREALAAARQFRAQRGSTPADDAAFG